MREVRPVDASRWRAMSGLRHVQAFARPGPGPAELHPRARSSGARRRDSHAAVVCRVMSEIVAAFVAESHKSRAIRWRFQTLARDLAPQQLLFMAEFGEWPVLENAPDKRLTELIVIHRRERDQMVVLAE